MDAQPGTNVPRRPISRVAFWAVVAASAFAVAAGFAIGRDATPAPVHAESASVPKQPDGLAPPLPDDLDQASADALAAQLDVERSSGRTLVSDGTDDGPGVWVNTEAFQQAGAENRQLDLPVYASATSTDPVGILTDGGVVDFATFQSPDFDVEQLILDRFGEDRLALYRKNGNHW